MDRQLRLFDWQIREAKRRIARIQQDWETGGGIYTLEESRARISEERQGIARPKPKKPGQNQH